MQHSYRRIGLIAALAMLSSLASASVAGAHHSTPASPTDPSGTGCGQVIMSSMTMTHDVGPCIGDGIIIRGTGVVLDMAGHTITGGNLAGTTSDPVNCCTPGNAGVKFDNVTGSTVKNGTIRLFNSGVAIEGGSGNTVDKVTAVLNLGSLLADYGEGVNIHDSDGNTVKNSRVGTSDTTPSPLTVGVGNGPYSGISLLGDSDYNDIGVAGGGNRVEVNIEPSGTSNQDDGIRLEPDYLARTYPDNNRITGNTVTLNALDGISVLAGPCPAPPTVCDSSTVGVTTANVIKGNLIRRNGVHTYAHRKGDGIRVFTRANGNIIGGTAAGEKNTVTENGASGIRVDSLNNSIQNNEAQLNCAVPDPQRPCEGSQLVGTLAFPASQGADLFDSRLDGRCGAGPLPDPPGGPAATRNKWTGQNSTATRNRYPAITLLADCIG